MINRIVGQLGEKAVNSAKMMVGEGGSLITCSWIRAFSKPGRVDRDTLNYRRALKLNLYSQLRQWRALLVVLGSLAAVLFAPVVHAGESVVLLNLSPSLEEAIEDALLPWDFQTQSVSQALPLKDEKFGVEERARQIGRDHNSRAVIWIAESEEGLALWLYDAQTELLTVRPLVSQPPFDAARAASLALTVKTLLLGRTTNHTGIASRENVDIPKSGLRTEGTSDVTVYRRKWALESQLTARHSAADDDSYQTRIALGVVYRLPALTMAVFVEFGSGQTVNVRQFRGDFSGLAVRGQLGYPLAIGHWQMEPELSLIAHATTLEGRFAAMAIQESRINPSIDLGFRMRWWWRKLHADRFAMQQLPR